MRGSIGRIGLRVVGLAVLLSTGVGCDRDTRQVWFTPNIGSRDLAALFTGPDRWPEARRQVDVFKFYSAQVLAPRPEGCAMCGDNVLPRLREVDAFRRLHQWGIDIALEVGAVKPFMCAAPASVPPTLEALAIVEGAGAAVDLLAMDEPVLSGRECGQSVEETAAQVAEFVRQVRAARPRVAVGDIEPYPYLSAAEIEAWIDQLRALGVPLAFFHLDVDREHAALIQADVAGDLARLRAFCVERSLPFGVIFWGQDGSSDQAYFQETLAWVESVAAAIGRPEHVIFQSWVASVDGSRTVPTNLPEDDAAVFSHTRLLREGLSRFPEK